MTRKSTLIEWGHHLGVVSNAQQGQEMTASQLELGIGRALVARDRVVAGDDEEPQYSLGDALAHNARVIREELPGTVKAIASNLLSR